AVRKVSAFSEPAFSNDEASQPCGGRAQTKRTNRIVKNTSNDFTPELLFVFSIVAEQTLDLNF
ncbi:MAG: hypothetical protein D3924_19790, partial [Candidatus Electrothrix sp. AR4]|nr:hypothetical protein [Candidatus Electrothrix sp. AR4]